MGIGRVMKEKREKNKSTLYRQQRKPRAKTFPLSPPIPHPLGNNCLNLTRAAMGAKHRKFFVYLECSNPRGGV